MLSGCGASSRSMRSAMLRFSTDSILPSHSPSRPLNAATASPGASRMTSLR